MSFISANIMWMLTMLFFSMGMVTGIAAAGQIGSPAPGFELPDVNGTRFDLESLRKRVVLLNFWAPWCVSCREELPALETLYERYSEEGFSVIGVSVDNPGTRTGKFLEKANLSFPILLDPEAKAADKYGVSGLPASFIIDRNGIVRYRHSGFNKGAQSEYEKEIKELLKFNKDILQGGLDHESK